MSTSSALALVASACNEKLALPPSFTARGVLVARLGASLTAVTEILPTVRLPAPPLVTFSAIEGVKPAVELFWSTVGW